MRPGAGHVAVLVLAACSAVSTGAAASSVGPVVTVDPAQASPGAAEVALGLAEGTTQLTVLP